MIQYTIRVYERSFEGDPVEDPMDAITTYDQDEAADFAKPYMGSHTLLWKVWNDDPEGDQSQNTALANVLLERVSR